MTSERSSHPPCLQLTALTVCCLLVMAGRVTAVLVLVAGLHVSGESVQPSSAHRVCAACLRIESVRRFVDAT